MHLNFSTILQRILPITSKAGRDFRVDVTPLFSWRDFLVIFFPNMGGRNTSSFKLWKKCSGGGIPLETFRLSGIPVRSFRKDSEIFVSTRGFLIRLKRFFSTFKNEVIF